MQGVVGGGHGCVGVVSSTPWPLCMRPPTNMNSFHILILFVLQVITYVMSLLKPTCCLGLEDLPLPLSLPPPSLQVLCNLHVGNADE